MGNKMKNLPEISKKELFFDFYYAIFSEKQKFIKLFYFKTVKFGIFHHETVSC